MQRASSPRLMSSRSRQPRPNVLKITRRDYSISGGPDFVLKLYHMTDEIGAAGIHDIQKMKLGSKRGMLGGGVYFAETAEQAETKAEHKGVLLEVLVHVGWMLVLTRESNHEISQKTLREIGCHSVKSVYHNTGPEYVVYDSDQVIAAWVVAGIPDTPQVIFPGPEWDTREMCNYDGNCNRFNPKHFAEFKHAHPPTFEMEMPPPEQMPRCLHGEFCEDRSVEHFMEFSHPAKVPVPELPESTAPKPYHTNQRAAFAGYSAFDEYERGRGRGSKKDMCPLGANCPYNDNFDHLTDFGHPREVIFVIQCERGMLCEDMSREHRREFSHKRECPRGAGCAFVGSVEHCTEFAHPPGTAVKVPCKDGPRCINRSEQHLRLYSHE